MSNASKALQQFCDRQMGRDYPHGHWDKDRVYFVLEEILPCCTPEIRAGAHVHMDHACGKEHLAVKWGTTVAEIDQELFNSLKPLSVEREERLMFGDRGKGGRPTKSEGPRVPYEDLDRILVFGEVVPCEDGNGTTVYYPSYRELAERYGVSNSVIADYAKSRNVQRRRKEAQSRIQVKAEQKLVEMRASAIAVSKDDELRIIDTYLLGFEQALADKRVRFDNAADFNTMVRLKEFVQGNADSRQEIHASLSLETLQDRHRRMMRTIDATPEERGEVENPVSPNGDRTKSLLPSPPASIEEPPGEPAARFSGRLGESEQAATVRGSSRQVGPRSDDASRASIPTPQQQGATLAEGSHGVVQRNCYATVSSAGCSAASGSTVSSRGVFATVYDAQQTASVEETHGQPTESDWNSDDPLADTLPPPPLPDGEGSCE